MVPILKLGYFETDTDLRYQDEVHGSLLSQADRVVDLLLTKYLKVDISYEGVTRDVYSRKVGRLKIYLASIIPDRTIH